MGRGGGGGARPRDAEPSRDSLLNRIGYAHFVLMHGSELALTTEQNGAIMLIDSTYHRLADTTLDHLDALHAASAAAIKTFATLGSDSAAVAAWRAAAIARRDTVGQLTASLRTWQQDDRNHTNDALSGPQREQVDALLKASGSDDRGGRGPGGGGGMRPPRGG